jgi:cell pole-organizing protein PopZ
MIGETTSGPVSWIKNQLAGVLEEQTAIQNSGNLNKWQKFFSRNFFLRGIMRMAGTYDRAFAQDAEDAELIGPVPNQNAAANANTETTAVKGLVAQLEEEIKKKEEIRNLSANEDEVRQLNDEIAALKEKLKILQMTSEEYKKYQESLDKSLKKVDGIFDVPKIKANTNAGLEILNQGVEAWKARNAKAVEQQAVNLEAINMMNEAITSGITSSLGELANMIAGVEGANVGNVVKALLSPLADAAISAGLLIMTTGKGIEALRDGLTKFFGIGAIAAGAALMAVGVAAKAGLAAIGSGKTGGGYANQNITSYSGGYGVNGNNYQQDNNFALSATLKGQDLLLSIQRTQQNNRR